MPTQKLERTPLADLPAIIRAHADVTPRFMEDGSSLSLLQGRAGTGRSSPCKGQVGAAGDRRAKRLFGSAGAGIAGCRRPYRLRSLDAVSCAHARDGHPDNPAVVGSLPRRWPRDSVSPHRLPNQGWEGSIGQSKIDAFEQSAAAE